MKNQGTKQSKFEEEEDYFDDDEGDRNSWFEEIARLSSTPKRKILEMKGVQDSDSQDKRVTK